MKPARFPVFLALIALLTSCGPHEPASDELYRAVDELHDSVSKKIERFHMIADIDHSRLAAAEGEAMPPARVLIFSDAAVNTSILSQEPMAGLDLPYRVLAYAEGNSPALTYTTSDFIQRRHGLSEGPYLERYDELLSGVVNSIPGGSTLELDATSVDKDEGIVALGSKYGFDETIGRLKGAILAESDTVWFGEIDYQQEAATQGVKLPRLTLLLWGAPAPGAKAMRDYPRMGLDAFCQKTLVYQPPGEGVQVLFNDMASFAEWHYGDSALPHRVISRRMTKTLGGAVGDSRE